MRFKAIQNGFRHKDVTRMSAPPTVFNEQQFESRLVSLKDSQDAINSLSNWCLQNREHHKKIVTCWLHCLKRVKIEQRLSLFYLANDVIQYSKRKHYQFVESWGTALQKATTLVRDDKVKSRIMRIFKIWDERGVYDEAFIADLCGLLSTNIKKKTETTNDSNDFQPSTLMGKIRDCKVLEDDTDMRFRKLKENPLELTDAESVRNTLKDRKHGSDIVAEVDHGVKRIEAYVKALELEIAEREKLIDTLQQATIFYETQRGEAKIVCNAYRNFGNKVKILKRKLEELIPTLSDSPIPSPDADAPSPSPDSDLELSENKFKQECDRMQALSTDRFDFSFANRTFVGKPQFRDINLQKEIFSDSSGYQHSSHSMSASECNVRPIEVINTRDQKGNTGFNIQDFLKSLLPLNVAKNDENLELIPPSHPPVPHPLQPPPIPPLFTNTENFGPMWKSGWEQGESAQTGSAWNHETEQQEWAPTVSEQWEEPPVGLPPLNLSTDTPESPPLYEKEGVSAPVEYDDSVPPASIDDIDHRSLFPLGQTQDMDHRIGVPRRADVDHRKLPKLGPKDIDHRNLISLTGSPRKENKPLQPPPTFLWPRDQDYRPKHLDIDFRIAPRPCNLLFAAKFNPSQPPPRLIISEAIERKDNVESIDMDVSEEEDDAGNLIQEDSEDKRAGSIDVSFLNQPNLTNFSMGSSFMDNAASTVPRNRDVDERLKAIFRPKDFPSEAKPLSTEYAGPSQAFVDIRTEGFRREGRVNDFDKPKPNGFLDVNQDGHDFYRREPLWPLDGTLDQGPPPPPPPPLPLMNPVGHMPRIDFPVRMHWNPPHPRGRGGTHRYPFRPHHPRLEILRPRLPFRGRGNMRGGRW